MYYLKIKKSIKILSIILLLNVIIISFFYIFSNIFLPFLNNHLITAYKPFERVVYYTKNGIISLTSLSNKIDNLKAENTQLKINNKILENNISNLEYLKNENEKLNKLLNLNFIEEKNKIYASVIANDMDFNFIINKGQKDGITKDMTVITEQGLVGKIKEVNDNTSIIEILENSLGISARIVSTNEIIFIKGDKGRKIKCTYIPLESKVKEGDLVKTISGSVYNSNIFIGEIEKVWLNKEGTSKEAYLKPTNNFNNIEKVIIIL